MLLGDDEHPYETFVLTPKEVQERAERARHEFMTVQPHPDGMKQEDQIWWEDLGQQYRREGVRHLIIGESAPAGGTFLYSADSTLFRRTLEAFREVYGDRCGTGEGFLHWFHDHGWLLLDLLQSITCPNARSDVLDGSSSRVWRLGLRIYTPR